MIFVVVYKPATLPMETTIKTREGTEELIPKKPFVTVAMIFTIVVCKTLYYIDGN